MAFIMQWREDGDGADAAPGRLAGFRRELYLSLGMRRDVLFEACDAALCKPGRVLMLAELCLEPECRRGHGAVYDALNCGEVRIARLRRALSGLPLRAWPDGRIRLAVDVSNWLRPDAAASPGRSFCHCYGRGKSSAQMIPGWPYSFVAALEPGRTSWTLPLDAVRLRPGDDLAAVTAAQVRDVVTRLRRALAGLPLLRAGQEQRADDPGLAVFLGRGTGARAHVAAAAAGRGPAAPGRRPGRGHRGPGPRHGHPADRRRALARGRPGHHGDLRRRVRAGPPGLAAARLSRAGHRPSGHQPGAPAPAAAPSARPDGQGR